MFCGAVFLCMWFVRPQHSFYQNSFGRYEWKGRSSGSGISALLLLPVCTPTVDVCEAELLLNGGGPAWSFTISLFSQMQECIRAPCHFLLLYHTESVKATAWIRMIQQKPRTQSKSPGFIHDSSKNYAPHALRVATFIGGISVVLNLPSSHTHYELQRRSFWLTASNGTLQATRITSCNITCNRYSTCEKTFKPHALLVATQSAPHPRKTSAPSSHTHYELQQQINTTQ